jgi:hypothetical protein
MARAVVWKNRFAVLALLGAIALLVAYLAGDSAQATHSPNHEPANKLQVANSNRVVFGPTAQQVLRERIRTSDKADLEINVNSECGIRLSQIDGPFDFDQAVAQVTLQVLVDNQPVPNTASAEGEKPGDDGRIDFCAREFFDFQVQPGVQFEQEDDFARWSNSYTWFAQNVGAGLHDVRVLAQITSFGFGTPPPPFVQGVLDRRSMVINPETNVTRGTDQQEATN